MSKLTEANVVLKLSKPELYNLKKTYLLACHTCNKVMNYKNYVIALLFTINSHLYRFKNFKFKAVCVEVYPLKDHEAQRSMNQLVAAVKVGKRKWL